MKGHNCLGHSSDLHKSPTTYNTRRKTIFFFYINNSFIILLYTFMKHKWGTHKQLIRGYTFDAGRTYKKLNHFRGGGSSVLSDLCFLYRGALLFHKCGRKF